MKLRFFTCILFVAVSLSMAQTGLMGGSDGIHQKSAKSLGKYRFSLGTGGNVTVDPWALTRGGVFYDDGEEQHLQDFKLSATGNFYIGFGLAENIEIGVGLPINYDRSYAEDYLEATGNIRQGDLDLWMKVTAPFLTEENVLGMALQLNMLLPTGELAIGLRPRHAWMLRSSGYTNPYTADEVVVGASGIFTFDFRKVDVPLVWNLEGGFMYAGLGSNTVIYSTGLNWHLMEWIIPFLEFSGEFRVEGAKYPIDFFEDPMVVTPGIRLHTPYGVDIAGGFDLSVRTLRNLGRSKTREMRDVEDYTITYKDEKGFVKTYGYVPSATIAFTGLLTWYFGGAEKAPERECPQGLPPQDTVAKTDTLFKVDTLLHVDTLVKVDTVVQTQSFVKVDSVPDSDHDGVSDDLDKCPDSPAGITVDTTGCPRDFDMDGVPDFKDMCPNTQPNIGVDSTGCAKDEDRDGVPDDKDQCPATGKGIPVDTTGCAMDTDRDGIADYQDKCPNTLRGVKVDKKGCPLNKKEDLEKLKKGVQFKSGSTVLTKSSYRTLDDIVALLNKFHEVNLEIQGHTDNVGDDEYNMNLSQGRAQSAVDYLIRKGIPVDRLRAVGFGPKKPIADNKKKAGRAKNRRVELVPYYQDQ